MNTAIFNPNYKKRELYSLPDLNNNRFKGNSMAEIRQIIERNVCEYYDVPLHLVQSTSREGAYVHPRYVIMCLLVHYTSYSNLQISQFFNKRDHSTVSNAKKKIEGFLTHKADILDKRQLNTFLYRYGYKVKEAVVKEVKREFVIDAHY